MWAYRFRHWGLSGFFALAFALAAGAGAETAQAADSIGYVKGVRVNAFGAPPGRARNPLYALDTVVSREVVETVARGALHVIFRDGSDFRLGSASKAILDRFVYDPNASTGELTISLGKGIYRLITGKMKKEGLLVVTPVALVGVRGTDFIVQVAGNGAIVVAVIEGEITISPLVPGTAPAVVGAGSTVAVGLDGQITGGVPAPPNDTGLGNYIPGADQEGEGGADGGGDGGGGD